MRRILLTFGLAGACLGLAACGGDGDGNATGNQAAANGNAAEGASGKTIAASLDQNSRFYQSIKAAGLDKTLGGSEPYTVLVADDAAFGKLPAGTAENWMKPENRSALTGVLTYHILPGVVLAADIDKAIENGKGKAVLATMGGGTITATKEGDKIVLTDSAGTKANVTAADQQSSNGVIHRIDAVLAPGDRAA